MDTNIKQEQGAEAPGLPEHVLSLMDPHAEEPAAEAAKPKPNGLPAHQVAVFDPASPVAERIELAANFDPHKHVRWEHRPAVAELDLGAIKVTGGEEALLSESQVTALSARGLTTVKAILRAGREGLKATQGIGATTADELYGWTMRRAAAKWALAELDAEGPRVEAAQAKIDAMETTATAEPQHVPPGPPHPKSKRGEVAPLGGEAVTLETAFEDKEPA